MVYVYTDKKYISGDIITDNESFFNRYITAKNIDESGRGFMEKIDGARILDEDLGTIITPLGATVLENISTGAKTVLNLIYLQQKNEPAALDITECGANALDAIFTLMNNHTGKIKVILSHADTSECENRDYCVNNDRVVHDATGLSIALMEGQNGNI
jgi:hypothetical protein